MIRVSSPSHLEHDGAPIHVIPRDTPEPRAKRGTLRKPRGAVVAAIIAAVLLAIVVIAAIAIRAAAPSWVRTAVERAVHERCAECTVRIGSIDLTVLRGRAVLHDVEIRDPSPEPRLVIRAREFALDAAPLSLLRSTKQVERLVLRGASVYVVQGAPPPNENGSARSGSPPSIRIDGVEVDGLDLHVLAHRTRDIDHAAQVRVDDIHGTIGSFGSRTGIVSQPAHVEARGRLQRDGRLSLDARIDPADLDRPAHIALDLRDFDLSTLDAYLSSTGGQRISGHVERAHANMSLHGRHVMGTLTGEYRGFDVHFEETRRRDAIRAAVQNVGEQVTTDHTDNARDGTRPSARIDATNTRDKPLPDFLLDSVLDAVRRLVQS